MTAGTIMQKSKVPLHTWFWGAFLVTSLTPGMSALQFQKMLGINLYETAFNMLHKLRTAMVRPGRDAIGGEWPVEVDETYVGGANTKEKEVGITTKLLLAVLLKYVRVKRHPVPILICQLASVRSIVEDMGEASLQAGYGSRFSQIASRRSWNLSSRKCKTGTDVRTDGWGGYDNLGKLGYRHKAVLIKGDHAKADQHLPMIHIVFGNLDAWLLGTHHGVSPKHLEGYLNEFVFRFNRRFWPLVAFDSVLKSPPGQSHRLTSTYTRVHGSILNMNSGTDGGVCNIRIGMKNYIE